MEICETCDRVGEVFQLPGRKDRNCDQCSADIAVLTSLHTMMKHTDGQLRSAELEREAKRILERLLSRCTISGSFCWTSLSLLH